MLIYGNTDYSVNNTSHPLSRAAYVFDMHYVGHQHENV